MAGWGDIGAALVGNTAGNELAYQKGLSLGANTQNAMQQARERVRQNTAMEQLPSLADELGIPAAFVTAIQAGVNPTQITGTAKDRQEIGLRNTASNPNVSPEAANVALRGLATAPVERYYAVGTGHADKFNDTGVTATPRTPGGGSGGDAAAIQVLRAFGLLDDTGHVVPGREKQAFDVMRTTGRVVDEGGVPGVVNFNPYAGATGGAAPAPAAPASPDLSELVPPVPAAAPVVAPPAVQAPTPAPAAPAVAAAPVSSAQRVGANVAEIAKQKQIGEAAGKAAAAAPTDLAEVDKLESSIDNFANMKAFDSVYGNVQGQPVVRNVMGVLNQDVADAQAALQNIDAQTFGISIDNMRGLGALSNQEGKRVTDAFTTLTNTTTSPQMARQAIATIKTQLAQARQRIQTKQLLPVGGVGAAPAGGVSPYADPNKEARYQAWKASQGR